MPKQNAGIVGQRAVRNFKFLYKLTTTRSPKKRWQMVQEADRDELMSIIDVCANVLSKDFKLTPGQDRKIQKYGPLMKKLSRVRTQKSALRTIQQGEGIVEDPNARNKRRRIRVVQRGGFLPSLLLPVLVEIASTAAEHLLG